MGELHSARSFSKMSNNSVFGQLERPASRELRSMPHPASLSRGMLLCTYCPLNLMGFPRGSSQGLVLRGSSETPHTPWALPDAARPLELTPKRERRHRWESHTAAHSISTAN
eukprot:bmy_15155T0